LNARANILCSWRSGKARTTASAWAATIILINPKTVVKYQHPVLIPMASQMLERSQAQAGIYPSNHARLSKRPKVSNLPPAPSLSPTHRQSLIGLRNANSPRNSRTLSIPNGLPASRTTSSPGALDLPGEHYDKWMTHGETHKGDEETFFLGSCCPCVLYSKIDWRLRQIERNKDPHDTAWPGAWHDKTCLTISSLGIASCGFIPRTFPISIAEKCSRTSMDLAWPSFFVVCY